MSRNFVNQMPTQSLRDYVPEMSQKASPAPLSHRLLSLAAVAANNMGLLETTLANLRGSVPTAVATQMMNVADRAPTLMETVADLEEAMDRIRRAVEELASAL